MTSHPPPKRQKTSSSSYELIYWPGMPGRGEHIRLLLEEAGASYTDTALTTGASAVLEHIDPSNLGDATNPPVCAPPILKHGDVLINQTPNILLYLGVQLGLAGETDDNEGVGRYKINELALTALDGLSNEPHDCHHPVATGLYYEDQIPESKRKSEDYVKNRLPKFLGYFERVLKGEASKGGKYLYGGAVTYADLVLFQCVDGLKFMFPGAMERMEKEGKFAGVFGLYERIRGRERIKGYLQSERRQKYSNGIYRYYEELQF